MKKGSNKRRRIPDETSLERYDWTKASRGRYAASFPRDAHAVVIAPDLWRQFGTAAAVNDALRTFIKMATAASKAIGKHEGHAGKKRAA